MQDNNPSPKYQASSSATSPKKLGGYLVEAGLLTPAQIDVVLNDQKITGMRFGEILAARGWVKQQTVEYFMQKVILPEKNASNHQHEGERSEMLRNKQVESSTARMSSKPGPNHPLERREVPISKPLPSIASDDDVSWVG